MAITKIISDNEAAIKAAIRSNGQGAITGDLLQEKMLLLNGDLFAGQVEYSERIGLGEVQTAAAQGSLNQDSALFRFMKEWYEGAKIDFRAGTMGELAGTYIALYGGISSATIEPQVVGYMHLLVGIGNTGGQEINCLLIGCRSHLLTFSVVPDSDSFTSATVEKVTYGNVPRWLKVVRPSQTITSYSSKAELCAGLGISEAQLDDLMAGYYAGLRTDAHIMPILVAGEEDSWWQCDAGHYNIDELGAAIHIIVGESTFGVLYSDYEIHQ